MKLSIIIPIYNEVNFIKSFSEKLIYEFKNEDVEYIFVNDGSNDGSEIWLKNNLKILYQDNYKLINLSKNRGKGYALKQGLEVAKGYYVLFHDADLEIDPKDTFEMYKLIKNNSDMKVLFGSRYMSGKLRSNKNFLNEIVGKVNSLIFNIMFKQSISDLHCGAKIISRDVLQKISLTIPDFGFEIDIASQIAKNNIQIYEYGIGYLARSYKEGKKITWKDGLLSYYYLIKTRFIDNDITTILSILYSAFYMGFIGSYFGMGIGNVMIICFFIIIGSFIGLKQKIASSSIILLFTYFGSLFSNGNGKIYTVIIGFMIGIYLASNFSNLVNRNTDNKFIKIFV